MGTARFYSFLPPLSTQHEAMTQIGKKMHYTSFQQVMSFYYLLLSHMPAVQRSC